MQLLPSVALAAGEQRRDEVNAVAVDDASRISPEGKGKNPSTLAPLFALTTGLGGTFPIHISSGLLCPSFATRVVPPPPDRASMMWMRFRPQLPTP